MTNATQHPHHATCPGGDLCTLDSPLPDADIARKRGWTAGTRLECADDGLRAEIEITEIGREHALSAEVLDGELQGESPLWVWMRCWGEVKP